MNPVAECESCGHHGPVQSRYERFGADTGTWHRYLFCSGKCASNWLLTRNGLPSIVTVLGHVPGQERG